MKITRRTSITSTKGVTLISDITVRPSLPVCIPIFLYLLYVSVHDVEEFRGKVFHFYVYPLHPADEIVICDNGRYSGRETYSGGDEGLGDTRGHGLQRGHALATRESDERGHDPPDRAEETDKRRCAPRGREKYQRAFELGGLGRHGPFERPFDELDHAELVHYHFRIR